MNDIDPALLASLVDDTTGKAIEEAREAVETETRRKRLRNSENCYASFSEFEHP